MRFDFHGPPEEAARELCRQLGLHEEAHREVIDNGDQTYNCRKCSNSSCPYNKLGDALSDLSAEVSLAQRLDEVEMTLSESLQLIRQIRLEEERLRADR